MGPTSGGQFIPGAVHCCEMGHDEEAGETCQGALSLICIKLKDPSPISRLARRALNSKLIVQAVPLIQCAPLQSVKSQIHVPGILPFSVRDAEGRLLLARGQALRTPAEFELLIERGALVDLDEVASEMEASIQKLPRSELPRIWSESIAQFRAVLRDAPPSSFARTLDTATRPVATLIARDPDLAIMQVLRQGSPAADAGVARSAQGAIAAQMTAQVLGASAEESYRAFKAALTMNISILELQDRLSRQSGALSEEQRRQIESHPTASRALLESSGVTDLEWLDAVAQHHEDEAGKGYPCGLNTPSPLAQLLRWSEVYTAMISGRAYRRPLAPDVAARRVFQMAPRNPYCAALIKAFGLYPPGCRVRLARGDLAVVVRRGAAANIPVVRMLGSGADVEAKPGSPFAVQEALAA